MALLPRYEQQLSASANRTIVGLPTAPADTAVADALVDAGKAGFEIAKRAQASKVEGEVVRAENEFRVKVDTYRAELEGDTSIDDEEVGKRLRAFSSQALQDSGALISSSRSREMWAGAAEKTVIQGDEWSRKLVASRQIDRTRARHVQASSYIESRVGDASLTEDTFETMIRGQKALVDQDRKRGFLSEAQAAEVAVQLDGLRNKDWMARRSNDIEALVRGGRAADADALIDGLQTGAAEKEALKAAKAATEREVRVEENLRQAAIREAQEYVKADLYVGIWDGKVSRAGIEGAVNTGKIDARDKPELLSALRSYQRDQEAYGGMTAAQKTEAKLMSDAFRSELMMMPADALLRPPSEWAQQDRDRWEMMLPADKAAVTQSIAEMRAKGQTSDSVKGMANDLMDRARLTLPKNWTLAGMNRGDEEKQLAGVLYRLAEKESKATGGAALTEARTRELVAQAYREVGKVKVANEVAPLPGGPANRALALTIGSIKSRDRAGWETQRRAIQETTGAVPSDEQVARAYIAAREGR